ncbi:hypothetical protein PENCOP_c003G06985 [Penicillium coprophilum]|uniref:Uncharacterized protein n=1 Tax=Penicillium coprophilum TaxID=36646 RepID=A0A1V6UZS2_9EURO|nr:hypothetical protein PENCOP_c003G06985 [Penicillium coprophilum]
MEKGNEADNANEDTVMADEMSTTEDSAKDLPLEQQQQQQQQKKKKRRRRNRSQASIDRRNERVRLRSMGFPLPPPPPQQRRDPALPPKLKRNQRHPGGKRAQKAKKAAYEAAMRAAKQAEEGLAAASTSPTDTLPVTLGKSIVPEAKDEDLEANDAEIDLGPTIIMTLVHRDKTSG